METPNFAIAFGAGLLTFFSPCLLPLIPAYLGLLTGVAPSDLQQSSSRQRLVTVSHAVAFLVGFSLVFLALGALASSVAVLLTSYGDWVRWIGGGLIVLLGLSTLGFLPLPWLRREARMQMAQRPVGYFGSALMGFAFAAGWSPCIGPIMASVLVLSAQTPGIGLPLLGVFVLGFSLPFLLSSWFVGSFKAVKKHLHTLERVGGVAMVLTGGLLATNTFAKLSNLLVQTTGFKGF